MDPSDEQLALLYRWTLHTRWGVEGVIVTGMAEGDVAGRGGVKGALLALNLQAKAWTPVLNQVSAEHPPELLAGPEGAASLMADVREDLLLAAAVDQAANPLARAVDVLALKNHLALLRRR